MKRHHMSALVAAAVLAVVAALWSTSVREPDGGSVTDEAFLPSLSDSLNELSTVALVGAGNEPIVTLSRGEAAWNVDQAGGYPADTGKLRTMLLALADARIAEGKTANPDNYHHLGVEDVSDTEAQGVKVTLTGPGEPVSVIVGKRPTREGTYVRLEGDQQSYLIDTTVDPERSASDWLDKRLMDIPGNRVQRVSVTHPDGEQLAVAKAARGDGNFVVEGIPEGRSLSTPGAANPMGNVLQGLNLSDVTPQDSFEVGEDSPVVTDFYLFNGVRLTARSLVRDGKNYAWFDTVFDQETASRFAPGAAVETDADAVSDDEGAADAALDGADTLDGGAVDGGDDEAATDEAMEPAIAPPDFTGAQEEAAELEAALAGWVFEIPGFKRQQMVRRMDDLLAPPPEPAAE